ncbi:ANTAR domain-containing protein [Streptomyces sp. NPDC015131]|uniref:ANTAR domain-containing protein n=1 Tax=Streptomyces sp. NPDC015131 TaxID=3364941 RepID=UPI0036F820DD
MTETFKPGGYEAGDTGDEVARLREQLRHLRARARNRPLVAEAQGLLRERYRLADSETAFALMQLASQRHNVRLRTLAEAVVRLERPRDGGEQWFPGRTRHPAPSLDTLAVDDPSHAHRGAVLGAVLSQTLAVTATHMGNVQIGDHAGGGLWMEKHTGLSDDFVSFFDHVGPSGTSCAQAAQDVRQVTVHDVATDPVFAEDARGAILEAGSRSCHSVPLVSGGRVLGMVSAHFDRPIADLHTAQLAALDHTGRQVGRWLAWYDRTVVLDALEDLHTLARDPAMRRVRRR